MSQKLDALGPRSPESPFTPPNIFSLNNPEFASCRDYIGNAPDARQICLNAALNAVRERQNALPTAPRMVNATPFRIVEQAVGMAMGFPGETTADLLTDEVIALPPVARASYIAAQVSKLDQVANQLADERPDDEKYLERTRESTAGRLFRVGIETMDNGLVEKSIAHMRPTDWVYMPLRPTMVDSAQEDIENPGTRKQFTEIAARAVFQSENVGILHKLDAAVELAKLGVLGEEQLVVARSIYREVLRLNPDGETLIENARALGDPYTALFLLRTLHSSDGNYGSRSATEYRGVGRAVGLFDDEDKIIDFSDGVRSMFDTVEPSTGAKFPIGHSRQDLRQQLRKESGIANRAISRMDIQAYPSERKWDDEDRRVHLFEGYEFHAGLAESANPVAAEVGRQQLCDLATRTTLFMTLDGSSGKPFGEFLLRDLIKSGLYEHAKGVMGHMKDVRGFDLAHYSALLPDDQLTAVELETVVQQDLARKGFVGIKETARELLAAGRPERALSLTLGLLKNVDRYPDKQPNEEGEKNTGYHNSIFTFGHNFADSTEALAKVLHENGDSQGLEELQNGCDALPAEFRPDLTLFKSLASPRDVLSAVDELSRRCSNKFVDDNQYALLGNAGDLEGIKGVDSDLPQYLRSALIAFPNDEQVQTSVIELLGKIYTPGDVRDIEWQREQLVDNGGIDLVVELALATGWDKGTLGGRLVDAVYRQIDHYSDDPDLQDKLRGQISVLTEDKADYLENLGLEINDVITPEQMAETLVREMAWVDDRFHYAGMMTQGDVAKQQ